MVSLRWVSLLLGVAVAALSLASCAEREGDDPQQQGRRSDGQKGRSFMGDEVGPGQSVTPVPVPNHRLADRPEPNFWDMSTWRLDFWNTTPPASNTPQRSTTSETGSTVLDRRLEYERRYGPIPTPRPYPTPSRFNERDSRGTAIKTFGGRSAVD